MSSSIPGPRVFFSYGCPGMRSRSYSLMARMMSIRNAARIHWNPLDKLPADLDEAINT